MRSAEIKNLCIALEALSRIPGIEPERLGERIHSLLDGLLQEEEKRTAPPLLAVAKDDEIPF